MIATTFIDRQAYHKEGATITVEGLSFEYSKAAIADEEIHIQFSSQEEYDRWGKAHVEKKLRSHFTRYFDAILTYADGGILAANWCYTATFIPEHHTVVIEAFEVYTE